mmetsp:Transcript_8198/g.12575  ORF Transcript_8198/g.12575 Transcript_8198/m.12575 type:complete len:84 (+) Transcript_8198:2300-2551(+)
MTVSTSLEQYKLWKLDLQSMAASDWTQAAPFQFCLEYSFEDANHKPLADMFIRSQSRKGVIDMNKKLIAFFLHKGELYSWQST